MELIFKMQVLTIALNMGVAIWIIIEMIILQVPPTLMAIVFLVTSWALMIKFNPVWSDLWSKWTQK